MTTGAPLDRRRAGRGSQSWRSPSRSVRELGRGAAAAAIASGLVAAFACSGPNEPLADAAPPPEDAAIDAERPTDASIDAPTISPIDEVTVCVLNESGPTDPCDPSEVLDFGAIGYGVEALRRFRLDNQGDTMLTVSAVTIASSSFAVATVHYEPDPAGGEPLRSASPLPAAINPGESLWVEVAIVGAAAAGALPAERVEAALTAPTTTLALEVPIIGSMTGCSEGFADCDGDPTNGCEIEVAIDAENCGSCGTSCSAMFPHSSVVCDSSGTEPSCSWISCMPEFHDLDGSLDNGCEYACTPTGDADDPDDLFIDENCDGIDGDAARAVFVAETGSDADTGLVPASPVRTLTRALAIARDSGRPHVYVSGRHV
ncbi:MAG: hypothetical protein M5U28_05775 [Sandaracinaceae bacterium]|nr:hypothetical protein [Sandaracinaceae bacterium]